MFESMTIPELGQEIERQEYRLLSPKSAESASAALADLKEVLRLRLLEALGEESDDPSVPEGFENGDLPIFYGGDKLERPEDIVGSWYLSDSFPLISSYEKMQQVEAELKRKQSALEAEEPENETEHGLWQFRLAQKAAQLDALQTMAENQAAGWEEWDYSEEPEDA